MYNCFWKQYIAKELCKPFRGLCERIIHSRYNRFIIVICSFWSNTHLRICVGSFSKNIFNIRPTELISRFRENSRSVFFLFIEGNCNSAYNVCRAESRLCYITNEFTFEARRLNRPACARLVAQSFSKYICEKTTHDCVFSAVYFQSHHIHLIWIPAASAGPLQLALHSKWRSKLF